MVEFFYKCLLQQRFDFILSLPLIFRQPSFQAIFGEFPMFPQVVVFVAASRESFSILFSNLLSSG